MSFFRKLWQDLKNGEMHAGALVAELGTIGFVLLLLLLGDVKKLIETFWQ